MGNATLAVYGRLGSDPRDREKARRRRSANADAACPQVAPENLPAELENLGPRQRRFTLIFTALGNGAEAARQAGYSEKSARSIGAENLTKLDILAAIRALHARGRPGRWRASSPMPWASRAHDTREGAT